MGSTSIQNLTAECKQIQEDSTYNAEVHHIVANRLSKKSFWCKIIPTSITVFSAFGLLLGVPDWVAWVTLLSGIVTMFNVFLEPEKKARENIVAAKNFTELKHEARSLHESFNEFMTENDFYHEVKRLREKYNLVVRFTPPTDDDTAWRKAQKRIKSGVHKADFRSETKGSGNRK